MRPSSVELLPEPDAPSARHSERVRRHIVECIAERGGELSFADYMHEALYAPGLGYYSAGTTKFGEHGDFTTAPEISPLFAGVVARQCARVLAALDAGGDIVELGAGSGRMAAGILAELAMRGSLPSRYVIAEVSADLRQRQRDTIARLAPDQLQRVAWIDDPATLTFHGVMLGNEVIDALPVERFRMAANLAVEQQVVRLDDAMPVLAWRPAPPVLSAAVEKLQQRLGSAFAAGFESELCLMLPAWLAAVSSGLERGIVLLSDYGYGRRDYYAPQRDRGTLTCHFRQHAHHDPMLWPGIQDITAWVDFSAVAESLRDAGLGYLGFTTQSQFLLHAGITELLRGTEGRRQIELSAGVKTLTLPGEMGERFRFIGFHRDCPLALTGFSGRDYGNQL